jgi:V8-like Glu-specific endopeptidase
MRTAAIALVLLASSAASWAATPLYKVPALTGPLESVCHLHTQRTRMLFLRGSYNSSGVLYRDRYVVTAAHNVYSPPLSRLRDLSVACGIIAPSPDQHQQVKISDVRVASSYGWMPKRFDRDFAVIRLPQPVTVAKPFRLEPVFQYPEGSPAYLAGFPGDDSDDHMNGETMFTGSGAGKQDTAGPFLHYAIGTHVGNSGGPVWTDDRGVPTLLGIHISEGPLGGRARIADEDFVTAVELMIADLEKANQVE